MLAKVTKADGDQIDSATDKFGLTNLPIASMFQDASLICGDRQIEGGQTCYPYLRYFSIVMQLTQAAQERHLTAQGWCKDEASKFEDANNSGLRNGVNL